MLRDARSAKERSKLRDDARLTLFPQPPCRLLEAFVCEIFHCLQSKPFFCCRQASLALGFRHDGFCHEAFLVDDRSLRASLFPTFFEPLSKIQHATLSSAREQQAERDLDKPSGDLSQLLSFEDNSLLPELFGAGAQRLKRLASTYGVQLDHRGNKVVCRGSEAACDKARAHLLALYARLKGCESLNDEDGSLPQIDALDENLELATSSWSLKFPKATLVPRNAKQEAFLHALCDHPLVFAMGPAGTGKTCIALGYGLSLLRRGDVERVILSRPVVEAGERLGFLPGDMREKIDPYLRPIFDLLHRWFGKTATERYLEQGKLEIAPLSFMRGRTIENAFLLLDEAQNTSPQQMKMVLTRLGMGARIAVTGDPTQTDLPASTLNGLQDAERRLKTIVPFVHFSRQEVVRHPLVAELLRAYENPLRGDDK